MSGISDWIHAIILGLVEGLTEFIPVSSTGMLLLSKLAMGLTDPFWDTFAVLIQLGAIMAVVVIYFRWLWNIALLIPTQLRGARNFVLGLLVAFIPAAVAGPPAEARHDQARAVRRALARSASR